MEKIISFTKIKVIGVGGAGNNAIDHMITNDTIGVEFISINTDVQVLSLNKAPTRLLIGKELTQGLGAGSDPEVGEAAAKESEENIKKLLKDVNLVFLTAGFGGGTGTGATPYIAKLAKEAGCLVIAIITTPFTHEGKKRTEKARLGIEKLKPYIDTLVVVSNNKLLEHKGNLPIWKAFVESNNVLKNGIKSITDLIATPALINLDFADVSKVIKNAGTALLGIGESNGKDKDKIFEAVDNALVTSFLSDNSINISGATKVIVNLTCGKNVTLEEAGKIMEYVEEQAGNDIDVFFGCKINNHLNDEIIVTIIATGFGEVDSDIYFENKNKFNSKNRFSIYKK